MAFSYNDGEFYSRKDGGGGIRERYSWYDYGI